MHESWSTSGNPSKSIALPNVILLYFIRCLHWNTCRVRVVFATTQIVPWFYNLLQILLQAKPVLYQACDGSVFSLGKTFAVFDSRPPASLTHALVDFDAQTPTCCHDSELGDGPDYFGVVSRAYNEEKSEVKHDPCLA